MTGRKILIHGYVVTMNGDYECIEDGAVLIEKDRIAAVGKTEDILLQIAGQDVEQIDMTGKMILPGLIDAHTHAGHCLNRSLGLDSRTRWMDYLTKLYHHCTTPAYWHAEGRLAALERLKAGITCGVSVISNAARCDDPRIITEHVRGHAEVGTRENPAIGPSNPPYPRAFAQEENGRLVEKQFTFDELMAKAEEAIELVNGSFNGLIGAFAAPFVMVSSIEGSKATPADLACRLTEADRYMMKSIREVARRQHVRIHTEAFGGMIRLAAQADDPRLDPSMLTNRERTRVVDAIRGEFGLAACLKAVGLKRSTYYYERGAIAAGDRYAVLRARVAGLFEQGGRAWGYRTIHRMLRLDESDPIVVSEKVVRRIMREGAMRPVYLKRPKRWSSYAGEIGEAPANLVERDFHADAPNMLWVTDVTQFTMDGYKCWLSPVVDCFDGMVVSWTLSRSPNADMANRMLLDAVATLRDGEHPIIHSD